MHTFILFLLFLFVFFNASLAATQTNIIDPATEWDIILLNFSKDNKTDLYNYNSIAPYMHVAIYNAVNYIDGRYTPYSPAGLQSPTVNPKGASEEAAAISAAYNVLKEIYATADKKACTSSFPLYKNYLDSLAKLKIPANDKGILIGKQAAVAIVGDKNCGGKIAGIRRDDGVFPKSLPDFVKMPITSVATLPNPSLPPGTWIPTLPHLANGTDQPLLQYLAQRKPFFIASAKQFEPQKPLSIKSDQYARDYNQTKQLGARTGSLRTPLQTQIGLFWEGDVPTHKSNIMRGLVSANPLYKLSFADRTRLYALYWLSMADTEMACFKAKYVFMRWRPETAIRNGEYDGNSKTKGDPNWLPLYAETPYAPEYPCAHCCWSGSIEGIANGFFGTKNVNILVIADTPGAGPCESLKNSICTRVIKGSDKFAEEVAKGRIYSGAHYQTSNDAGRLMGNNIALFLMKKTPYFKPVKRVSGVLHNKRERSNMQ